MNPREEADRIEHLLDEVQGMVGPIAWPRVQELVQRLVGLYGIGLERMIAIARTIASSNRVFDESLADDELVSSLLLLHGLHPSPVTERVERALDRVRPYLSSHAGGVDLLSIHEDGTARIRMVGSCDGCPSSRATIEQAVQRAIEDAAPEVVRILVEGSQPLELVQISKQSAGSRGRAQWVPLPDLEPISNGERHMLSIAGIPILLLRLEGLLYAYRNSCTHCGAPLDTARLFDGALECSCGAAFDVVKAGLALDRPNGPHLVPFPLLIDEGGPRIALEIAA